MVPSKRRWFGSIAVLVLGLVVSACVSGGQLANLTATPRPTIAIESIEAPPSTDVPRFVTMLKDEAAQRRIAERCQLPVARIPRRAHRQHRGTGGARDRSFGNDLDRVDAGRL